METSAFDREKTWIDASQYWSVQGDPFIRLNIQMLMNAEQPLIAMEDEISRLLLAKKNDLRTSFLLTQHGACAAFWMLGLYEALRLLRSTHGQRCEQFNDIFRQASVIRMPLAKHEVISASNFRKVQHYPTSIWCAETGKVGWSAFEPKTGKMIEVYRIELADQFLAIRPT